MTKLDAWVGVIMVFHPGYWDWGPKVLPRISSAPLRMSKLLLWFHGRKVSYAVKLEQNRISFLTCHAFDI